MKIADKVIDAAFESNEVFQQRLSKMIKEDLGLKALEFSEQADDPSKHSLQNPFRKQRAKHKDI
ncbi:MAG: hypothetical protein JXA38_03390 [Methanosarcinaceae archaeon]|nr:hypothetical protein [Methanosarcinaceae archaeon]